MSEVLDAPREQSLAREYVELRVQLEAVFRHRFPGLRGLEGDLYNEAWESLLRRETPPDSTFAFLERALYNRGLDELRRRARRPGDSPDAAETARLDDFFDRTAPQTEESVVGDLGAAATNQLLLDRLTARQARILKLRHQWDLSVRETAAAIGASQKTVRRELAHAAAVVGENVTWLEPCGGRGRRSLVRAYVLGILSERRAAKALAHLDACPGCRALRDQMEEALRGVAAAVPASLVAEPPTAAPLLERVLQGVDAAREQLADLAVGVKQQAAGFVARTPGSDAAAQASASGGPRGSGAMIAAAASSLVIGGGGVTYSVVEGVPGPIRAAIGADERSEREPAKTAERAAETVATPAPVVPPVVPAVPVAPTGGDAGDSVSASEEAAPPAPPAEEEFGIEQTAPPVAGASSAQSPPEPAPAPSDGSEEFGFER